MQANGGQLNMPAVAQNLNLPAVLAVPNNEQEAEAQLAEAAIEDAFALGVIHPVPLPPAPYVPAGAVYESDDDYEDPDPPVELLE